MKDMQVPRHTDTTHDYTKYIKEVDSVLKVKEIEIMEV